MFILDPDGFIREINQTAYARLGYTRDEMLGKHISEFILPECADMLVGRIAKADVESIAKLKMPDLNANTVEAAMSMVAGTARSMGIVVEE